MTFCCGALLVGACGGASGLGDGQTEEDADDEARSSRAHRRPGTSMAGGGGRCLARLSGCLGGLSPGLGGDLDCLGRFQRMHTLDEVLIIFWHRHGPLSLQPELFDRRFRVMAARNTVRGTVCCVPRESRRPARDAGIGELEIVIDSPEQYPYRFIHQQVSTIKQALPYGDCGVAAKTTSPGGLRRPRPPAPRSSP